MQESAKGAETPPHVLSASTLIFTISIKIDEIQQSFEASYTRTQTSDLHTYDHTIHSLLPAFSLLRITTSMACEIPVWCAKTREWRPCTRAASCIAETFLDGQLIRKCCCKQHKPKAIEKLVQRGAHDVWGQRTTWRLGSQVVNAHVRVEVTATGVVEHVSRGTVEFGPMTERAHLDDFYDEYHEEYSRIGMARLQHEDDEWRARYEHCARHMLAIEERLDTLSETACVC